MSLRTRRLLHLLSMGLFVLAFVSFAAAASRQSNIAGIDRYLHRVSALLNLVIILLLAVVAKAGATMGESFKLMSTLDKEYSPTSGEIRLTYAGLTMAVLSLGLYLLLILVDQKVLSLGSLGGLTAFLSVPSISPTHAFEVTGLFLVILTLCLSAFAISSATASRCIQVLDRRRGTTSDGLLSVVTQAPPRPEGWKSSKT